MKRIIAFAIVCLAISACCGGGKRAEAVETLVEDSIEEDSVVAEIVQEEAKPLPVARKDSFERIKRADGLHTVDFDWPLALKGVGDIEGIQLALKRKLFHSRLCALDIHAIVDTLMAEDEFVSTKWKLRLLKRQNGMLVFKTQSVEDYSPDGGNGYFDHEGYLYYDVQNDEPVTVNHVISNAGAALEAINRHIDLEVYRAKAEHLPEDFIISPKGILFIFPKYEIGYGCQGEVKISLTYKELRPALSPYFLQLMGMD